MPVGDPIEIQGIIQGARMDKDGAWKLTISVPLSDGAKVAALTAYIETVFRVQFTPEMNFE